MLSLGNSRIYICMNHKRTKIEKYISSWPESEKRKIEHREGRREKKMKINITNTYTHRQRCYLKKNSRKKKI